MAFADLFTFSRPRVGTYRDAKGVLQASAQDQPRFDHLAGAPRGLLVEGPGPWGRGDRLGAVEAAWPSQAGTVLHEYETPTGQIRRRAFYAPNPGQVIDGLLHAQGWHRRIGVIPGYLKNLGGHVSFRDLDYALGGVFAVAPDLLLDTARSDTPSPLIEG